MISACSVPLDSLVLKWWSILVRNIWPHPHAASLVPIPSPLQLHYSSTSNSCVSPPFSDLIRVMFSPFRPTVHISVSYDRLVTPISSKHCSALHCCSLFTESSVEYKARKDLSLTCAVAGRSCSKLAGVSCYYTPHFSNDAVTLMREQRCWGAWRSVRV